jgi:hypothetical protein
MTTPTRETERERCVDCNGTGKVRYSYESPCLLCPAPPEQEAKDKTRAALRELTRLSEEMGLYGDVPHSAQTADHRSELQEAKRCECVRPGSPMLPGDDWCDCQCHPRAPSPQPEKGKAHLAGRSDAREAQPSAPPSPSAAARCDVCGWPLKASDADGCVPGNCSQRPRPAPVATAPRREREDSRSERWAICAECKKGRDCYRANDEDLYRCGFCLLLRVPAEEAERAQEYWKQLAQERGLANARLEKERDELRQKLAQVRDNHDETGLALMAARAERDEARENYRNASALMQQAMRGRDEARARVKELTAPLAPDVAAFVEAHIARRPGESDVEALRRVFEVSRAEAESARRERDEAHRTWNEHCWVVAEADRVTTALRKRLGEAERVVAKARGFVEVAPGGIGKRAVLDDMNAFLAAKQESGDG